MTSYVIAGYAIDRSLAVLTEESVRPITQLNVAFGHIKQDAVSVAHLQHLHRLEEMRRFNPELTIMLSIGGWGVGGFSEAAATPEGRRTFAMSAVDVLGAHGFDGIDLDWEYPTHGWTGVASSPDDKANFTLLLKELREALDRQGERDGRRYALTIAAGADQFYLDGTNMAEAQTYLDLVQLMTYDLRGGFQTLTGHHTNLYASTGDMFRASADAAVRMFAGAGVPKEKLVIGAALYSRKWTDVPDRNHGLHQPSPHAGGFGPLYDELVDNYIDRNGFVRYWDEEAKAPYLYDGSTWISYEDERSIRAKCDYVKAHGLAGIMFWEYGGDKKLRLLPTLREAMR